MELEQEREYQRQTVEDAEEDIDEPSEAAPARASGMSAEQEYQKRYAYHCFDECRLDDDRAKYETWRLFTKPDPGGEMMKCYVSLLALKGLGHLVTRVPEQEFSGLATVGD